MYSPLFCFGVDLEWKLTYVGSAEDENYDQMLDSVLVGPVAMGTYRFIFQADCPDYTKIPSDDLRGVTVLLLTCSYNEKEFIRIGYYVNIDYEEESLRDDPPDVPDVDRLVRSILADKPRVTKFTIDWDDQEENKENDQNGKPINGVGISAMARENDLGIENVVASFDGGNDGTVAA